MSSKMEADLSLLDCLLNASRWLSANSSVHTWLSDSQSTEVNLVEILGPQRSPFFFPVTAVYLLIFFVGLSGNVLTCTVIARHKKMRNPTNLYLLSLALSDVLLLLLGMPLEIYELWQNYPFPFGEAGCYFKTFLLETVCFASILNVTALSVERYTAVLHPLKTRSRLTNQHVRRVIVVVWLLAVICAVPNTSLHGIFYLPQQLDESAICTVLKPIWIYNMTMQITTVCFYLVPMVVISVLYLLMALHLARQRGHGSRSLEESNIHGKTTAHGRKTQVNKMLFIVVTVFGLCWAPFHIERLLWSSISHWTDVMHNVYQYMHIVSGFFFYLSSAVNPIIYSLLSTRFRESFRELMCSRSEDRKSWRDTQPFTTISLHRSIPSGTAAAQAQDPSALVSLNMAPNAPASQF